MNPRFRLRAYEQLSAVRTAAIVAELVPARVDAAITRAALVGEWQRRFPQPGGSKSVRARISKSLWLLKSIGAVRIDGEWIAIGSDASALRMAAGNLDVVQDHASHGVPRHSWATRPAVPHDLRKLQDDLIHASRVAVGKPSGKARAVARTSLGGATRG
jgi:hypothetical protein